MNNSSQTLGERHNAQNKQYMPQKLLSVLYERNKETLINYCLV